MRGGGCGGAVRLEVNIVREGTVEVALNGFFVIVVEVVGLGEEGVVERRLCVEESVTAGIVKPSGATPGGWDTFTDIALSLDRSIREARG